MAQIYQHSSGVQAYDYNGQTFNASTGQVLSGTSAPPNPFAAPTTATAPASQPASQTPPTPAPVQSSPSAPTTTPSSTTTGAPTQQGTQTGTTMLSPQQMTPEQIKQYYESQGQAVNPLSPAQWLEQQKKYNSAFNTAKDDPNVPQSQSDFNQTDIAAGLNETEDEDPLKAAIEAMGDMDPVTKSIFDYMSSAVSAATTKTSLVEEFKTLYKDELGPLNTELMDINRIMDGTEDDIRDEVAAASGFVTESQVQAMTLARNKTLLKRASQLQEAIDQKTDYINQIVKLTGMDRDAVEKDLDRKLGLAETVATTFTAMKTAARDSYNKVIENVGYKGLSRALMGNPKALADAEKTLGLAKGALSNQTFLDLMKDPNAAETKPFQHVSATDNQPGGYFDPNTGKFVSYGYGGGGGAGSNLTSPNGENSAYYDAFRNAIIGLGPQTRGPVTNDFSGYMQRGDLAGAKEYITSLAINRAPAEQQSRLVGRAGGIAALDDIQGLILAAKAKNANLNLYTGTTLEIAQKLGSTPDPDLSYIGARMKMAVQDYRRAMSGVAFSEPESKEYKAIMPDVYSIEGLNMAKIMAARDAFNANNRALLSTYMGGQRTYDALYGAPTASKLPSQRTVAAPTSGATKTYMGATYKFDGKEWIRQ